MAGVLPLDAEDPLAGAEVMGEPSVYWEHPQAREAVAGWGEAGVMKADSWEQVATVLRALSSGASMWWLDGACPASLPGPWFGGMRFSAGCGSEEWAPFGFGRWTLPEVMVWREGRGLRAAAFAPEGPGADEVVRSLLARVGATFPAGVRRPRGGPRVLKASSSRSRFESSVERAVRTIASGDLQKVVLARAVDVEGERPFDRVEVLARLREQNPRCVTFSHRAPGGAVFLGATPETLCRLEGRELWTEALAGTAPAEHAGILRGRDKERREHEMVVRYLTGALERLAEHLDVDEAPMLLQLKHMVHLRTGIHACLREGVGVAELVAALHPTPAVGGAPSQRALEFLAEHEALDRGWYAAPVGWVGAGRAHQMVALRSAWIQETKARLFVGAGIVAGSIAEAEWRETELKSMTMLRALGGEAAAPGLH